MSGGSWAFVVNLINRSDMKGGQDYVVWKIEAMRRGWVQVTLMRSHGN